MDEELKKRLDELAELVAAMKKDIVEFRKTQEQKFKDIEVKGETSDETQALLDKLASRLDEMEAEKAALKERIDKMETTAKRHGQGEEEKREDRPFKSFGEQLLCVAQAENRSIVPDARLMLTKQTGLSEGIGADGGFLVQTDFSTEILKRTYEVGQIAQRTRRIPITTAANGIRIPGINETSRVDGSRYGGVLGYWRDEAAAKTASQPAYRTVELSLKKLTGLVYATDELLQDAAAIEAFIMMALPEELTFKAEDAFIRGTGAGMPLGILNSGAVVTVLQEPGQAANTLIYENVSKMYSRMWARSRPNAVWFINQDCEPQMNQMFVVTGASGTPVYLPAGGLSQKPYGTLFGRPVIPVEYCSTVGTVGDIIFADMSQYVVIEKGGIQAASSIHVRFLNDETVFRFVYRVDGQPLWNQPLTPYQGTNTQSPFIVTETR